jgi:hypothetical protein
MADMPGNRLTGEKPPYLLQHAHNPVEWYPWGDEALSRAKNEDKVIFLSSGTIDFRKLFISITIVLEMSGSLQLQDIRRAIGAM